MVLSVPLKPNGGIRAVFVQHDPLSSHSCNCLLISLPPSLEKSCQIRNKRLLRVWSFQVILRIQVSGITVSVLKRTHRSACLCMCVCECYFFCQCIFSVITLRYFTYFTRDFLFIFIVSFFSNNCAWLSSVSKTFKFKATIENGPPKSKLATEAFNLS